MLQKIKGVLKRFLPPPVHAFNREVERILAAISRQQQEAETARQELERLWAELGRESEAFRAEAETARQELERLWAELGRESEAFRAELVKQQESLETQQTALTKQQKTLDDLRGEVRAVQGSVTNAQKGLTAKVESEQKQLVCIQKQAETAAQYAAEAVWAEIFNNTITGSVWLQNRTFSPGRWAVGYQALYVIYRVLNEARPKRILELGLGQSTRMIAQYAAANDGVEHLVVEHDPDWIAFFKNDFVLSDHTGIVRLEREMVPYKEAEAVRVFKGFQETFAGQKFDFIVIDAPLGGDMKQYARIDVLGLLPDCLSENFVIMMDDVERSGEAHTMTEMASRLDECGIPYKRGNYSGKKVSAVLAAESIGFLTTL